MQLKITNTVQSVLDTRHGFLPVEAESVDSVILATLCAFQLIVPLDLAYIFLPFFFFISGLFLLYARCDFYLLIVVLVDVRVDECMYLCAHECVVCCVYVCTFRPKIYTTCPSSVTLHLILRHGFSLNLEPMFQAARPAPQESSTSLKQYFMTTSVLDLSHGCQRSEFRFTDMHGKLLTD